MPDEQPHETHVKIVLLGSSTMELLRAPLDQALRAHGFVPEFWLAGFGQYRQAILDDRSGLYAFGPDAALLYIDAQDVYVAAMEDPLAFSAESRRQLAAGVVAELRQLLDRLRTRLPETLVLLNTVFMPPRTALSGLEYNTEFSLQDLAQLHNQGLRDLVQKDPAARIVDVAALMTFMGSSRWSDSRLWYLARSRWSRDAMQALARRYAAVLSCERGRTRKCVVLDLDNVLWGGIVGEDGPDGILLGEEGLGLAYVEFQQQLLNLNRKGILLAVCSKNNPDDALAVIRRHPGMRLREDRFAAVRINWEDKDTNLRSIADELNLGLDTLVFIDDSPVERAWVRQASPQVLVPEWPDDATAYVGALLELEMEAFEKLTLTAEDRRRGEEYSAQGRRRSLAAAASSLEEFYASLQMRATIGRATPANAARIAQLTQRTNQFNLTTRRYTEAEIVQLMQSPNIRVYRIDLADRFGQSGIVGALVARRQGADTWEIDTLLLSCRVLGRTVEEAFLGYVQGELAREGARRMIGEYRPTPKNASVADLYPRLGYLPSGADERRWVMDLDSRRVQIPEWFEVVADEGDPGGP